MNKPLFIVTAAAMLGAGPLSAGVHEVEMRPTEDGVQLSWITEAVNRGAPFHFPTVQVQMSRDLVTWEDAGQAVAPPISEQAQTAEIADIATEDGEDKERLFFRLSSFFDGKGLDLSGVDFSGADLRSADFEGADLTAATFDGAVLLGAQFRDTTATDASWANALIEGAIFDSVENFEFAGESIGSPRIVRVAGEADRSLFEALPPVRYYPLSSDYPGGYKGIEGLKVSPNTTISRLKADTTIGEFNRLLASHEMALVGNLPSRQGDGITVVLRTATESHEQLDALLTALKADSIVEATARDVAIGSSSIPIASDASVWDWTSPDSSNWAWQMVKAPQMWNLKEAAEKANKHNGEEIPPTGLIDSWVNANHLDLSRVEITESAATRANGHGTHVAGIMAADHNGEGIDGINPLGSVVAFNTTLDPSQIPNPGSGFVGALADYIESIAELYYYVAVIGVIGNGAEVVNVSLGIEIEEFASGVPYPTLEPVLEVLMQELGGSLTAIGKRELRISAAGNASGSFFEDLVPVDFPARLASPLNYDSPVGGLIVDTIVVESVNRSRERSTWSNVGGHLSAPGERILSIGDPELKYFEPGQEASSGLNHGSGTSQAAAFVTGIAGFLLSVEPDLGTHSLSRLLIENADDSVTGGAPLVDGWASVMDIDRLLGVTRVLEMLVNVDDGTEDGVTRINVPLLPDGSDRNFEPVEHGDVNEEEDADNDGGMGDEKIDISDFRRFRDWLLYVEGDHALNGESRHSKHDLNRDGESEGAEKEKVFPRGDFNGDGVLDRNSKSKVTGVHGGEKLTDLEVLSKAPQIWDDEIYPLADLEHLIDSVDLHIHAANFFAKNADLGVIEMVVGVYRRGEDEPLYEKRKLTFEEPTDIVTVPVGAEYEVRSDIVDAADERRIQLVSPGTFEVKREHRGADLVIDLVPLEQTVRTTLLARDVEILDSDPLADYVESIIEASNDLSESEDPQGGAASANDQMTFEGHVSTGIFEDFPGGSGADTVVSEVILQRPFIKQPNEPNPKFRIAPITLRIIDGAITEDKRAAVDLRLEMRVGQGEWQPIFHTHTEIAGQVFNDGSHNFEITQHEGDLPKEELLILKTTYNGEEFFFGAEYRRREPFIGEVPLDGVEEGAAFELRYTLAAEAFSALADEVAEAYIGDPLDYGEASVTMEYGSFGELFSVKNVEAIPTGGAAVTHRSRPDYYFVLERTADGEAIAVAFGQEELGELVDANAPPGVTADDYYVRGIRIDRPQDQDGDGIDDVYELQRPDILDPLVPTDALSDPDGDGYNNRSEYENGTDPQVFDEGGVVSPDGLSYPGSVLPIAGTDLYSIDLNDDGRLDFVSRVGSRGGHLEVILASPDGSFQSPVTSPVIGSDLDGLAIGELDGDAFPDAVVLDGSVDGKVTIFLGNGDGSFTPGESYPVGQIPSAVRLGDADGDGALDVLVVLNRDKQVLILSNQGGGTFAEEIERITLSTTPIDVVVGAVDKASPELAITHQQFIGDGDVTIYRWDGTGYGNPQEFPVGATPVRVITGDLNGDGDGDFVTADANGDTVSVLLSTGDGGFSPAQQHVVGDSPQGLLLRDVTGDGRLDLVVSHERESFLALLRGDGSGAFAPAEPIYTKSSDYDPLTGDWNGDGVLDLAVGALVVDGIGGGEFAIRRQLSVAGGDVRTVAAGDTNGDGQAELVVLGDDPGFVEIWDPGFANGVAENLGQLDVAAEAVAVALADIDGDGRQEMAVASRKASLFSGEDKVTMVEQDGGSLATIFELPLDANPSDIVAAELDGDTAADFLIVFSDKVVPLINDGAGQFSAEAAIVPGGIVTKVTTRDFDGDGDAELILATWSVFTGGAYTVYSRNADGTYSEGQTLEFAGSMQKLFWADADGDGVEDLIAVGSSAGTTTNLSFAKLESGQLAAPATWVELDRMSYSISHSDFNGDGKTDLLVDGTALYLAGESGFERQEIFAGGTHTLPLVDVSDPMLPTVVIASWEWGGGFVGLLSPNG